MAASNNRMRAVWKDKKNLATVTHLHVIIQLLVIKIIVQNDTNLLIVVESLSIVAKWFSVCRLSMRNGCL